jgi:hypothetical protein
MYVTPADVEVGAREIIVLTGQLAVIEPAEEQGRVRHVLQRLRPAVEVGLEVLERDPVPGHGVPGEFQDIRPHQVQEFPGAGEVVPLSAKDAVPGVVFGGLRVCGGRVGGGWPSVSGHG